MGGTALTVTIPGTPPRELSPNARVGWQVKARYTKAYRETAYLATLAAGRVSFDGDRPVMVALVYSWGNGRQGLDHDNALAIAKAGFDGIADALGVNDKVFRFVSVEQVRDPAGVGFTVVTLWQTEASGEYT